MNEALSKPTSQRGRVRIVTSFAVAEGLGTLVGLAVGAAWFFLGDVKGERGSLLWMGFVVGVGCAFPYAALAASQDYVTGRLGRFLLSFPLLGVTYVTVTAMLSSLSLDAGFAAFLICVVPFSSLFRGPGALLAATWAGGIIGLFAVWKCDRYDALLLGYFHVLGIMGVQACISGFVGRWHRRGPKPVEERPDGKRPSSVAWLAWIGIVLGTVTLVNHVLYIESLSGLRNALYRSTCFWAIKYHFEMLTLPVATGLAWGVLWSAAAVAAGVCLLRGKEAGRWIVFIGYPAAVVGTVHSGCSPTMWVVRVVLFAAVVIILIRPRAVAFFRPCVAGNAPAQLS